MRALTVSGITLIAAVGVDVGLTFLRPGQWLPVTACAAIGDLGIFVSSFIVPALFIFASIKARALKSLALRAFLAVLVSWFLAIIEPRVAARLFIQYHARHACCPRGSRRKVSKLQNNDKMHPSCGGAFFTLCNVARRSRVILALGPTGYGVSISEERRVE